MTKEQFITSAESAETREARAAAFDAPADEIAVYRVRGWQPVFAEV